MTAATAGYIGGLIAVALVAYLASTAAPGTRHVGGRKVLYYAGRVKLIGWILLTMVAPIAGFFLYSAAHVPSNQVALALTAAVAFVLLPLVLILEFHGVTVSFDATTIFCESPWGRSRAVPWVDILSIKYSPSLQWYVVKTKKSGPIRLNKLLSGLREFLTEAERREIAG